MKKFSPKFYWRWGCWRWALRSTIAWGLGWLSGLATIVALVPRPVRAAERLVVRYYILERSIPIASLTDYAATGEADVELAVYLDLLPKATRDRLPELLSTPLPIRAVEASQFLYSPQGEFLLRRLSTVFSTGVGDRDASFKGLRGAIIQAAHDPDGLTPIALLEAFPTRTLYLRIDAAIAAADSVRTTLEASQAELSRLEALAAHATDEIANDRYRQHWRTVEQRGDHPWRREAIEQRDPSRNVPFGRRVSASLYVPDLRASATQTTQPPTPLVVISHGVGSDRESFHYLAEHLASHGLVVLAPEHAGSNAKHLQALLQGSEDEIAKPSEFDDRPRDISLLLDAVTRRVAFDANLMGRIDTTQAIVIGQSFGGYTALALAGATLNDTTLRAACTDLDQRWSWNLSLLLQCRLLALVDRTPQRPRWRDDRVRGIIPISPIGSAIFDDRSLAAIDIPVLLVAASADTIAPVYAEQLPLFEQLSTPDRRLVVWQGGTHFSPIAIPPGSTPSVALPSAIIGPEPQLAHRDLEALSLAFIRAYFLNDATAHALLDPRAIAALSNTALPVFALDTTDVPAQQ